MHAPPPSPFPRKRIRASTSSLALGPAFARTTGSRIALVRFFKAFDDAPPALRAKIVAICAVLIAVNLGVWAWALIAFCDYPLLLGTALLAYGFGLRHAVDADHIAAIDNVTRKLMQDGKRPATVGFFFSLGHSTVVLLASFAIAAAASVFQGRFESFKETGELIGTQYLDPVPVRHRGGRSFRCCVRCTRLIARMRERRTHRR